MALLAAASQSRHAQPTSVSFKGKSITIVVGFATGGGYDLYARLIAAHLGNHLEGKPQVVVQNVPGAASVKAAMLLYNVAPKDGTVLGLFLSALTLNAVLGERAEYHPERFTWIGRINDSATLGVAWHTAPARTIEEARQHSLILASTGASGNSAMVPWALNALVGTRFRVIPGYSASAPMALAMEQGEVHGIGAVSLEYLTTLKPDWLPEKKVNVLYSIDLRRKNSLPDVPAIVEFARDGGARQVFSLLGSASAIGYSLAAPPGLNPQIAQALDAGFSAMIRDRAFLADAARRRLDIDPRTGTEVRQVVETAVATPAAIVEMARKATAKPN